MKEIIVALDNIRSALNVGAIFRTCDGAGVKKLILSGITPYPPHPKVVKTSIGAHDYVDFQYIKKLKSFLTEYKNKGFTVVSIEQTPKAQNFFQAKLGNKCIFIFGNELVGVSLEILNLSDFILDLPMNGFKNSLNVATTAGIVLYNTVFSQND